MSIKVIINSFGIILNIIGAYILFKNSPINFDVIDAGFSDTDWKQQINDTKRKNDTIRFSVYAIIIGSVLQLISNFL